MQKTDCPACLALLAPRLGEDGQMQERDIPETVRRTLAVWATQECRGKHDLVSWIKDPT